MNRYDEAIVALRLAIRIKPSYAGYQELGSVYGSAERCYTDSGRLADGIAYFKQLIITLGEKPVVDGRTTSTPAHYALGMMNAFSGDAKAALDQYKILKAQGKGRPAELAEKLFNQIYQPFSKMLFKGNLPFSLTGCRSQFTISP